MSPHIKPFLKTWYTAVHSHDQDVIRSLLSEDIQFYSPAFFNPKEGRDQATQILYAAANVFEDFTYTKEWISGHDIILEFSARVGDKKLKGIDRITLNETGEISVFEVMIRPMNGLMALAQAMQQQLNITPPKLT